MLAYVVWGQPVFYRIEAVFDRFALSSAKQTDINTQERAATLGKRIGGRKKVRIPTVTSGIQTRIQTGHKLRYERDTDGGATAALRRHYGGTTAARRRHYGGTNGAQIWAQRQAGRMSQNWAKKSANDKPLIRAYIGKH